MIQRFEPRRSECGALMEITDDGQFIFVSDHEVEVNRLNARIITLETEKETAASEWMDDLEALKKANAKIGELENVCDAAIDRLKIVEDGFPNMELLADFNYPLYAYLQNKEKK